MMVNSMYCGVAPLLVGKFSNEAQGTPGSMAHISTNPNLSVSGKLETIAESAKEYTKDTFSLVGAAGTAAVAGSLAVANSNKCAEGFKALLTKASDVLSNSTINGKNVKELITNTKVYDKIKGLPIAAKAGIAAGAVALAILSPIVGAHWQATAGYIEGKHEGQ